MASAPRFLMPLSRARPATPSPSICAQCHRSFGSAPVLQAGHNKWSKVKHIKAVKDKEKSANRLQFYKLIALNSKRTPDPEPDPGLSRPDP